MSRRRRIVLAIIVALPALIGVGWFVTLSPLNAVDFTETTCNGAAACVTRTNDGIAAFPTSDISDSTVGFIFYTGARVTPEAYAPVAERVAAAGYPIWIPSLTLNFAVLDQNAAAAVIAENPDIDEWIIAGHSLGGAMAARFAAENDSIGALALVAAYPESGIDLSSSDLLVTSIYGTEDGLATMDEIRAAAPRLPSDTTFVAIDGGNHAQFGNYGDQRGDNPASISRAGQWRETATALVKLARTIQPLDRPRSGQLSH